MKLPRWALNATLTVLAAVEGVADRLGQRAPTGWQAVGTRAAAVYPVSRQGIERATLLGVQATHEIYLEGLGLLPRTRVTLGGVNYVIQDSRQWQGFAVQLAQEVT